MRIALTLVALAVAVVAAAPAGAATTHRCRSADLRYSFMPGGPKTFGVFKLKITNGRCARAHRVAKEWMRRFELALTRGRVKLPRTVYGFTFVSLPPNEAQTYRLRGRRGSKTIRFSYRVPNG
jgi:hypothetical protein